MARPKKPENEKYVTPVRQIGRVDDDTWKLLKKAAEKRGESFTAWALEVLIKAAVQELKQ